MIIIIIIIINNRNAVCCSCGALRVTVYHGPHILEYIIISNEISVEGPNEPVQCLLITNRRAE